jgi:hypothetical protein
MPTLEPDPRNATQPGGAARPDCKSHGLDPNERLPNGELRARLKAHPDEFTHNTGAGGRVEPDHRLGEQPLDDPDALILPSDSPGG